ncbi:MAG: integrase core domain-containing protein [bacterium]
MLAIASALFVMLSGLFRSHLSLQLEVVALRHQLAICQRRAKRPRLRAEDRAFWVLLSRIWSGWRSTVVLVQPATVVRWQKRRFRDHWRRLTESPKPGRPPVAEEIRRLIRQMSSANPLWGAPRIVGELRKIGIPIAKSTVETYMVRNRGPASPTWKSFLRNHRDLVSADFFVVPTVRFGLLWVFVLIASERRRVVHFNVTDDPTSEWAARQIVEAFPYETAPRFLLRDRDGVYGKKFSRRVRALGIEEVLTAYRCPWQNGYVERLIGTIRRDCLDHVIVWNERHLKRVLRDYLVYYHRWRTHLSLEMDTPERRPVQGIGRIVAVEELGGLHHHYERRAA